MGHQINQNGKTKSINQEKWIIFEKRLLSILSCFDKSSPFLRPLKWPYVVTWNPPETNPPCSQTKIFRAINNTGQAFSILIEGKTENMCYSKKRWTKNIFSQILCDAGLHWVPCSTEFLCFLLFILTWFRSASQKFSPFLIGWIIDLQKCLLWLHTLVFIRFHLKFPYSVSVD